MASKYLIVNNDIRMSSCIDRHMELVGNAPNPIISGGGRFYVRPLEKKIFLYDKSDDFGSVTKEGLISALNNSWIFQERYAGYSVYLSDELSLSEVMLETNPIFICE